VVVVLVVGVADVVVAGCADADVVGAGVVVIVVVC